MVIKWGREKKTTYLKASSLTLLPNSSLYNSATREEYFFFVSESVNNDPAPCLVKNSVADAFPPIFMLRSWLSCQVSRFVELCLRRGEVRRMCVIYTEGGRDVPDERDMNAQVSMDGRTVETDVDTECDA